MTLTPDLKDQVALVTGAGRGIGRAVAMALARCGAKVALAARSAGQLAEAADAIRAAGGRAMEQVLDIADESQVVQAFARVRDELGRLDVLVNNAGLGIFGPTAEFAASSLDAVIQTNVRGTFLCCREALKLMLPAKRGYIINIASVVGIKGYPRQAAYTASKHAVMGLTKSLAAEVSGQGVRVSAILPGGVDTGMVGDARPDLKREELLHVDDVAQSVLYLLSLSDRAAVDQIYLRRRNSAPF